MTFLSTVFLDVSLGLLVGISFSVLTIVLQGCFVKGYTLASQKNSEVYVSTTQYQDVQIFDSIMVFKYESILYFTTASHFKEQVQRAYEDFPRNNSQADNGGKRSGGHISNGHIETVTDLTDLSVLNKNNQHNTTGITNKEDVAKFDQKESNLKVIVLDCSAISYIDIMGLDVMREIREDFQNLGVDLVLACCSRSMLHKLQQKGLYGGEESNLKIFVTVHDAVMAYNTITKDVYIVDNEFYDTKL